MLDEGVVREEVVVGVEVLVDVEVVGVTGAAEAVPVTGAVPVTEAGAEAVPGTGAVPGVGTGGADRIAEVQAAATAAANASPTPIMARRETPFCMGPSIRPPRLIDRIGTPPRVDH